MKIKLTQDKYAIVDDEDFEYLNQWKWYYRRNHKKDDGYAIRGKWNNNKQNMDNIRMHRVILGAPKNKKIDHVNGNSLDNRKSNLRYATNTQNIQNSKIRKDNSTGFKGVHKKGKKYQARITINKKLILLGYFYDKVAAGNAYKLAANKYFGEFARYE